MKIFARTAPIALVGLSLALSLGGWPASRIALADSLEDFDCHGVARHIFINTKAADSSYEMTEHYCELPNGSRQGTTKISYTDLTGETPATYTWGQFHNDRRVGKWVTVTVTGELVGECTYADGVLKKEVGSCAEE